jgi:RNA polymerase Rpb4.
MEYDVIDEKIISETELKDSYLKFVDKGSEMGKRLVEHVQKNAKVNDFEAAFNEINELGLGIREDYVRMVIDAIPTSVEQLRAILSPLKSNIKEEDLKKILAVVKKHL